jgi:hypothetical protein
MWLARFSPVKGAPIIDQGLGSWLPAVRPTAEARFGLLRRRGSRWCNVHSMLGAVAQPVRAADS